MIRVGPSAPPAHYNASVKVPGEAFLRANPTPSGHDWDGHNYWTRIHNDLYTAHGGICDYSASWTARRPHATSANDHTSIDHYIPKSVDCRRAYEWDNFRLSRARLNHRKGDHCDVMDPCGIQNGWFALDFTTFRIRPNGQLPEYVASWVRSTITRLQLNTDNDYVNERIAVIREYALGKIVFVDVQSRYPFIAQQMAAQNFDVSFRPRLNAFFARAP